MMRTPYTLVSFLALSALLAMTWIIYAPGLHGSFLFDDFANLPPLGATGPVDNWPSFWRYITSGIADPFGRPLTLLTFLFDAHDWPADPYPFKRTNVILHLINGALLALLLRRLGHEGFRSTDRRRLDLAAIVGAGFWLLHPLFVSTTLYVVQREAMLPATFTLLGLLTWLHGRRSIQGGHTLHGLIWVVLGLGGCTFLGVLSKANGILLPALALVVEHAFLRKTAAQFRVASDHNGGKEMRLYKGAMLLVAWLPTSLVAGYLLEQGWSGLTRGISSLRPWTLGQRLLTEPRVLLDYLDLLWLPRPFTPGLFNDHIQASTSLFSPATTLPALILVFALIAGAWLLRRRQPTWSLAILFFFVGQSLESSTVAIELYFEHRNYLPAMLMFWPLALWLCGVRWHIRAETQCELPTRIHDSEAVIPTVSNSHAEGWGYAKLALATVLLAGIGLMTHARASLWGNVHDQALLWAKLNPDSPRAQANAAQIEMQSGDPAGAAKRLREPFAKAPEQVQLALNLLGAECQTGRIEASTLIASREALRTARDPGSLLTSWFERAIGQLNHPPCPQLTDETVSGLLQAGLANPYLATNSGRQQDLHYLQGYLALIQHNPNLALTNFNKALDMQVRPSAALKQAALLGSSGFPRQGLSHLDHLEAEPQQAYSPGFGMPRIHDWVLQHQQYWPKELARLRATLRDDAMHQKRTAE
jgi:protein O-mannosyl-transferase